MTKGSPKSIAKKKEGALERRQVIVESVKRALLNEELDLGMSIHIGGWVTSGPSS